MKSLNPRASHRLHVEEDLACGREVALSAAARRHAAALRLREGDAVILFDGRGGEYAARLERAGHERLVARTLAFAGVERESPLRIRLAVGLSAGERMDYLVQKATELGAAAIVPLLTERCVVRLDAERAARRLEHWRAIAIAACEQCGRNRIPEIGAIAPLDELLRAPAQGERLVLDPEARHRLGDVPRSQTVVLLAGPEGGLSQGERDRAAAAGFMPIRFGPRTLRTETAPLAALAALQALQGDC
ncbi:MAG: 16S rRNA (uracil(1498)-N(3))-methyltransferase [Burkholderiales bacterium]|nr:16S rRNA (uracil(1498)-N(3))-methyltransferase [Burkholderiales bacterium]